MGAMHMTRAAVALALAGLATFGLLALPGCTSGITGSPTAGEHHNNTDPNAPKVIDSTEITYLYASFEDERAGTNSYEILPTEQLCGPDSENIDKGEWAINWEGHDPIFVSQDVVDTISAKVVEIQLAQINGISDHTDGLPPGLGEYTLNIEYASGEFISSHTNNGAPYEWRAFEPWLQRYMDTLFAQAGDEEAVMRVESYSQIESMHFSFSGGSEVGDFFQLYPADEDSDGYCLMARGPRFGWDDSERPLGDEVDAKAWMAQLEQQYWLSSLPPYNEPVVDPDIEMLDGSNHYELELHYTDGTRVVVDPSAISGELVQSLQEFLQSVGVEL